MEDDLKIISCTSKEGNSLCPGQGGVQHRVLGESACILVPGLVSFCSSLSLWSCFLPIIPISFFHHLFILSVSLSCSFYFLWSFHFQSSSTFPFLCCSLLSFLFIFSFLFINQSSFPHLLVLSGDPHLFPPSGWFSFWIKHPPPDSEYLGAWERFRNRSWEESHWFITSKEDGLQAIQMDVCLKKFLAYYYCGLCCYLIVLQIWKIEVIFFSFSSYLQRESPPRVKSLSPDNQRVPTEGLLYAKAYIWRYCAQGCRVPASKDRKS